MAASASGVAPTCHNFFYFSDDSVEFSSDNDEDFEGFRYLNTQDTTVSFPTIELFVPSEDRDFGDNLINNWFHQDQDPICLPFVQTQSQCDSLTPTDAINYFYKLFDIDMLDIFCTVC